ncbi:YbhB/YbcL family Raf kinase inhibitor-like protein [Deinococcus sp.]|uniref:YbhB/YbcL family Raf kinase inhibitor-like protein n=1 Tax=Deinococcus sp. TaxID=47478 RepID=UPI003C7E75C2
MKRRTLLSFLTTLPCLTGLSLLTGLLLTASPALASGFSVTLAPNDPALSCHAPTTPALSFGTPPAGTKAFAVIFWDQQPGKLTGRWTVYDLPLGTSGLAPAAAGGLNIAGGKVGTNEAGQPGFTAPCATGRHELYVDFYALNVASLNLPAGTPLQTVHAAIKAHKILEAKAHVTLIVK